MAEPRESNSADFDLMAFAKWEGYVTRNLHDGGRVPPGLPARTGLRASRGHTGPDSSDAIVGERGYITYEGNGRIGWYYFNPTDHPTRIALRKLAKLSANVVQLSAQEAAGDAPLGALRPLLVYIRASRVPGGPRMDLGGTKPHPPAVASQDEATAKNTTTSGSRNASRTTTPSASKTRTPKEIP